MTMWPRRFMALLVAIPACATAAAPSPLDLSQPFGPGWQLLTSQGPGIVDAGGNQAPGTLHLCLTRDGGKSCRPALDDLLASKGTRTDFDTAHYLNDARVVYPRLGQPLLWVQVASMYSGDGDQIFGRMALRYDPAGQRFVPVYRLTTGHNNNQEVRFVTSGKLRGAIISAVPTGDAPFAYWITVNRRTPSGPYAPVLRYRSGTRYGDGNTLAVIDSEMPEIQRRLKLWRPGQPLPLPEHGCVKPQLIGRVLRCRS